MTKLKPFKYLDRITFNTDTPLKEVLERFNETAIHTEGKGFAIIVDYKGKCVGVVSDGDIRRQILEGVSINSPVSTAVNSDFSFVSLSDDLQSDDSHRILRQFDKRQSISNLPVLNEEGKVVDLYQYSQFTASMRAQQRTIRARVPVRVSYSGGGTDVSKYFNQKPTAVLSSTINKYCTTTINIRTDDEIHIISRDLGLKYVAKNISSIEYGDKLDLIKSAVNIMQPECGIEVETFAEFEPGTGLGGSSALVVSVLGALNFLRGERQLDLYQLADLAYQAERIDMKILGGWQDQYATAFGGFSWIEFRQDEIIVMPLMLPKDLVLELQYNLMLFRLEGTRSSSKIQQNILQMIDEDTQSLDSFVKMSELAVRMKECLLKGKLNSFGSLLDDAWTLKKRINAHTTNPLVNDSYNTALELGAIGGKLLGAGESGYLLIYAPPVCQGSIKDALSKKGVFQDSFQFSQTGLEVWTATNHTGI